MSLPTGFLSKERAKEAVRLLRTEGLSLKQIAIATGLAKSTVSIYLKELGLNKPLPPLKGEDNKGLKTILNKRQGERKSIEEEVQRINDEWIGPPFLIGVTIEQMAIVELLRRDWCVAKPVFQVQQTDIVIWRRKSFNPLRIEVKGFSYRKSGAGDTNIRTSVYKDGKKTSKVLRRGAFEFLMALDRASGIWFIIPEEDLPSYMRVSIPFYTRKSFPDNKWVKNYADRWDLLET